MRIPYARACYGQEEVDAVGHVLANPLQLGAGPAVEAFEDRVAALFAKSHGVMLNSGSSANLLALASLDLPPGSEVITPALTFATTVAPILQLGLRPVFVDVEPDTYVVDVEAVRRAFTERTGAVLVPLLLGAVPDMQALGTMCWDNDVWLIEDSCDTLGATWAGKPTGTYTDISTTSFYASHIITCAGGGGLVASRHPAHADRVRLLANWGRASVFDGRTEAPVEERYRTTLGGEPYDRRFVFLAAGYNLQATELQAAFGLAQLDRLDGFIRRRRENAHALRSHVETHLAEHFAAPKVHPSAGPCWLAFPLRVRPPHDRQHLAKHLEAHGIQTRPIMAGNILRQPGFRDAGSGTFPHADEAMRSGLLVGCHQSLGPVEMREIVDALDAFVGMA